MRETPASVPTASSFSIASPSGELFLRLFNADGSEAELSGNGTRCVAAWLASSEGKQDVALGTHGGLRTCHVVEAADPLYLIESEMGVPRVMPRTIELPGVGNVAGAMVNVGNPHFVLFVETEDFSAHGHTWQQLGAQISTSPLFPHGTNVEFVRVLSHRRRLRSGSMSAVAGRLLPPARAPAPPPLRRWCCAMLIASLLRLPRVARNALSGPANDAVMRLTGPAEIICRGEVSAL